MTTRLTLVAVSAFAVGLFAVATPASADPVSDYTTVTFANAGKKVVYPRLAKMREQGGTVTVAATIGSDGSVAKAIIENSSGNAALDEAAVKAVNDAAPYPAPPGGGITVHGTVKFTP